MNGSRQRRRLLQGLLAAGACVGGRISPAPAAQTTALPQIFRSIPSTGERLPAIGIGTNAFDVTDPADIAQRREVLAAMPGLGATFVDSARGYGLSEQVIGRLLAELGTRGKFFLATKPISAPQADAQLTPALIDESFASLQVEKIDLLQVHSLVRMDELLPRYQEYKRAGRIRYVGVTTASARQFPELLAAMRRHPIDFIQVNYSIGDRSAAAQVLPLARERGIAVINNVPFGGRNGSFFPKLAGRALPAWAAEFDATTWAQFMLKYNLANPAITVVIPGTTSVDYLRDNQQGGRGRLPDASMQRRMEAFWSTI